MRLKQTIAIALLAIIGVVPVMAARCVAQCESMMVMQSALRARGAMPGMEHCGMMAEDAAGKVAAPSMQCAHHAMQHPSQLPAVEKKWFDATPLLVLHVVATTVIAPAVTCRSERNEVAHTPPPLERLSVLRI